ncbi:MAG: hypothetical protein AB8G95_14415 [Anaerolineae bacterium]
MGSFNWQDEEGSWDATKNLAESAEGAQALPSVLNTSRLVRVSSLAVIGLLLGGGFLWWWVGSVEEDLSADVLQSWNIVVASQAAGDTELLVNQLSGSDANWINTQKLLLERNAIVARGLLLPSLVSVPAEETPPVIPTFIFAPDLFEATLSHQTQYQDRWGREVNLLQDEIFRLGADRWLFSPPKATYWGVNVTQDEVQFSNRFSYSAPAKDIELAEKIILWFEDRLDAMCLNEFSYACKTVETPQVSIRFSPTITDRILKQDFYAGQNVLSSTQYIFEFPTPSLIGTPATDADERLLIEAYGELYFADYLRGMITIASGYEFGEDVCLYAVAEYAAQQVDAIAPLTVGDYERYLVFNEKINQDGFAVALDDVAQQAYSELFLKLTIRYRLQEAAITPQYFLDENLSAGSNPFCRSLSFENKDEWETFNRYVELRASIQN